jgi:hypothetical protein
MSAEISYESLGFPVLGIPPGVWPGTIKLPLRSGVKPRSPGGGSEQSVTVALTHAYYLPGQQYPAVVIGQTPAYPGREGSGAALQYLLRSPERPVVNEPAATTEQPIQVGQTVVTGSFSTWSDPRISRVRFEWQDRRIEIAAWDYPLDSDFFRSLSPTGGSYKG